ncbi:hypothetical protein AMECASPLE_036664 [Ameca splendens]|uniref:Uncharacterized protein n=1 Tax=Ameca splendens TaxID=208324 RepID=A0ABV0Y8C1_9TELE
MSRLRVWWQDQNAEHGEQVAWGVDEAFYVDVDRLTGRYTVYKVLAGGPKRIFRRRTNTKPQGGTREVDKGSEEKQHEEPVRNNENLKAYKLREVENGPMRQGGR